jgi:FAD/FMN-containing dehydrogenase
MQTTSIDTPLYDYGKLYQGCGEYKVAYPESPEQVQALVSEAGRKGLAVRVRASGHTFSGATLPRSGELLIRTDRLDHFRFETPGTLTVGAGAIVWDVRDFVAEQRLRMPVYNGGWAGPTIGGYVNAGGMGLRVPPQAREAALHRAARGGDEPAMAYLRSISETYGGFWEHVDSITLVDGSGTLRVIPREDADFPWLFGSFGQLGVVIEVRLRLLAAEEVCPPYPLGLSGRIPRVQADDPAINDLAPPPAGQPLLYWFSYLAATQREPAAWDALGEWAERHHPFLLPQGGWVGPAVNGAAIGYRYLVRFRNFNPPLLYPRGESFVLMGVMALFNGVGRPAVDKRILEVEREFIEISRRLDVCLYPQAENIGRNLDYANYYGEDVFEGFTNIKERFDPNRVINPGVVFDSGTEPPRPASLGRTAAATFARLFG